MSWNCSCKHINNDEANSCMNCGRKRPKYLGVKVEFGKQELTEDQLGVWYLMIAHDYLKVAQEVNLQIQKFITSKGSPNYKDKEVSSQYSSMRNKIVFNCKNCLKFIEEVQKLDSDPQFKDCDNATQDIRSIKSLCYFEMGSIEYNSLNFAKAIDYFQKSFNADPNQISIFNLALSTMNLPVEGGGGLFSGKKTEEALANKKGQEIELLRKTIQFGPFSQVGINAASVLYEKYNIVLSLGDFSNL